MPGMSGNPYGSSLAVSDGKPREIATYYAGAVRVRVLPYDRASMPGIRPKGEGETLLVLEITGEPKLSNFRVEGSPRVDKAIDDQGQALSMAMDPMPNDPGALAGAELALRPRIVQNPYILSTSMQRELVPIRLKLGDKQAKSLKEFAGAVTAEFLAPPEPLLTIDDVMKATGKSAKGKNGGELQIVDVARQDDGLIRLKIRTELVPGDNLFGGAVQVLPGARAIMRQQIIAGAGFGRAGRGVAVPMGNHMPALEDAKGKAYQLINVPSSSMRGNGNVINQEMTLEYRANDGQGEPARLVIRGQRNANVQVPFSFKNINLP
jgi:hypothetical protein